MTLRIHIEYKSNLKVAHLSDLCFPLTGIASILWSENEKCMKFCVQSLDSEKFLFILNTCTDFKNARFTNTGSLIVYILQTQVYLL